MQDRKIAGRLALGRADIALLALLLALSLLPLALLRQEQQAACYADITLEGELFRRVMLTGHPGTERIAVETEKGKNIIEVRDGSIAVVEADCPDRLCVKAGRLSHPGETAACLPHGLLLEVKGDSAVPVQDDVIMVR